MMSMSVAVGDTAAVNNHTIVEQRSFALGERFQFVEKISQLSGMKAVDPGDLCFLLFVPAVVGQVMMSIRHAHESVIAITPIIRNDETGDTSAIGLEGQSQQIVHEPNVLFVVLRYAIGPG